MPREIIGLDAKLYIDDGGSWVLCGAARSVTVTRDRNQIDVSRRGSSWRQTRGGLRDFRISFDLIKDDTDNGWDLLNTANNNDSTVKVMVLDGDRADTSPASKGYQSTMRVLSWNETQPLEDVITNAVELVNDSSDDPTPVTGPV